MKLILTLLIFGNNLLLTAYCFTAWSIPKNLCSPSTRLRDTSRATTVIGNGTLASCNQTALSAAFGRGGIIRFNCSKNGQVVVININKTLNVSKVNDTIIDGEGLVTLNGQGLTRIIMFDRGNYPLTSPTLTVQRIRFINGRCQDQDGGCAILQKSGGTTIINSCSFENNVGPTVGQDVAGGAIWTIGGGTTTVNGSVFRSNACSNGGAIGILGSGLVISNTHFERNRATGNGGNPGNGGNGGAISFDGRGRNNTICATRFSKNEGNKYGGAFFRVSYTGDEQNVFDNVLIDGNFIWQNGSGLAGGLYIQGGTVTIRNSTIVNNSATGAGGIFFSNDKYVTLTRVNILFNKAYTGLGAGVFCSNPVSGIFSNITVANNYAGAFGSAFASCGLNIILSHTIIANNTVGNPWPANACTTMMNFGRNVNQSPINKQSPASGIDSPCTNGTITRKSNITVSLSFTSWKIGVIGVGSVYLGPSVVPGL